MAEASGPTDLAKTAKDLFAGAVGGIAQVLIGQPFDIIKVRLQTHPSPQPSALACAARIWTGEGALAFYKGTLTPLLGIGACVSVQFGSFHAARRFFEARSAASSSSSSSSSSSGVAAALTPAQLYLSGAAAGLANAPLSTPIEHVRIRLQTQTGGNGGSAAAARFRGPLDCARQLGIAGLYRGGAVTAARELQAYGVWFLTFEALMGWHVARVVERTAATAAVARDAVPPAWLALYGGLAGEALWLSSYPLDVVKSRLQTDGLEPATRRYRGAVDCARKMWAAEGWRAFWRGIGPTLLRAMPVSAGTFVVVEYTRRLIN